MKPPCRIGRQNPKAAQIVNQPSYCVTLSSSDQESCCFAANMADISGSVAATQRHFTDRWHEKMRKEGGNEGIGYKVRALCVSAVLVSRQLLLKRPDVDLKGFKQLFTFMFCIPINLLLCYTVILSSLNTPTLPILGTGPNVQYAMSQPRAIPNWGRGLHAAFSAR